MSKQTFADSAHTVALDLAHEIGSIEGKYNSHFNRFENCDRAYILNLYAECFQSVTGGRTDVANFDAFIKDPIAA